MLDWTEHEPSQAGIDRAALSRPEITAPGHIVLSGGRH
jgi:hypothetical protein